MFESPRLKPRVLIAAVPALLLTLGTARAAAQTDETSTAPPSPTAMDASQIGNTGRISFSGSVDVLSGYMFRGIRQDDRGAVAWPALEMGLDIFEGNGALRRLQISVGLWNSLHTGPTGLDGPSGKMWYEADFYSTLTLGFGAGVTLSTTYTAYTSPNSSFGTVKELAFAAAVDDSARRFPLAPYALLAFELEGQADGGSGGGTYMEAGVEPSLGGGDSRVSVALPVKIGLSMDDYYEGPGGSRTFGYVEVGAIATVPLRVVPSGFGDWSFRSGLTVMALGESLRALNDGRGTKLVGSAGFAFSY